MADLLLRRPGLFRPFRGSRSFAHGAGYSRTVSVSGCAGTPKNISCVSRRSRNSARVTSKEMYSGHNQCRRGDSDGQNPDQFCTHHDSFAPPSLWQGAPILFITAPGPPVLQTVASLTARHSGVPRKRGVATAMVDRSVTHLIEREPRARWSVRSAICAKASSTFASS